MPEKKILERLGLKRNEQAQKVGVIDFGKERPKYERINNKDLDALITLHDNIAAHMESSARNAKDVNDLADVERQIEHLYQRITRKN
jgi:hypothetical protein